MKKVITYGTYDLLHFGHIRLLERAKELGDYLVVGVTSDGFDKIRGKINVQQSLMERIEAVKATGIADEIIVEEYEGQKIDDIRRLGIDVFTVGSDWVGYFDYLKEYCEVVYLDRTKGISSTEIRQKDRNVRLGFVGGSAHNILHKYYTESLVVNGAEVAGIYNMGQTLETLRDEPVQMFDDYDSLFNSCDALYIVSKPELHYEHVKKALLAGKHVLCEAPMALRMEEIEELEALAKEKKLILMDAIKTAYATAYNRLLLIVKSGRIGDVVSVDATCTSLSKFENKEDYVAKNWNSICAWGPTALLPVFQLLGTNYEKKNRKSLYFDREKKFDSFTRISFDYPKAVANIKVGVGAKSEGELVVSGTKGYVYVPAPWWKTDYFEVRYENQEKNKRYFYQLDGEGIRYELSAFIKAISSKTQNRFIDFPVSKEIVRVIDDFYQE
ncbi:Gfo/Idh/MocA family oxidoreductase [Bulleidia sp. zg-1006]|uniref:Gfo/Idh/MocA family oxidoreductase n=1 Tax=Bulleidia sp. zg-1006 TaxID=2806552 RepID=UPI001939F9F1|nr:Gfo/Idh/MocA family oxidoreductase [Bulleidia sp. zg-1006]